VSVGEQTTEVDLRETAVEPVAQMRGVRAGAIVLVGVTVFNAGNYLFHVLAGRVLGPVRYGDLATLIAISGLVALPAGGVQVWVARHVAQNETLGDADATRVLMRRTIAYTFAVASTLTILFLTLAWPIQQVLDIASIAAVVITALVTLPASGAPVLLGLAQGLQRFTLVAVVLAAGPVVRIVLTAIAFGVGLHVGGAMLATLVATALIFGAPMWLLRGWFRSPGRSARGSTLLDAKSLVPVIAGLLALTALTSNDVVVAKAALDSHDAGIYGSASLIGRAILYLPTAIAMVLLPRVAARTAENRQSLDLLGKSVAVTFAFCAVGTAAYAVIGTPFVRLFFGDDYASGGSLLWLFGVAMTLFSVINVLLTYHIARSHTAFAWLLLAGAGFQVLAFLVVHGSAHQLLAVDVATAALLLVAHEVLTHGTLTRALHELLRDLRGVVR
jgi:O-antigen/teichoic acid export membrane protein